MEIFRRLARSWAGRFYFEKWATRAPSYIIYPIPMPQPVDSSPREYPDQLQQVIRAIALPLALPLFTLFWLVDCFYVPELKWEFLWYRLTAIPICLTVHFLVSRRNIARWQIEFATLFLLGTFSALITLIGYRSNRPEFLYYQGLNTVLVGSVSFFPMSWLLLVIASILIYAPFVLVVIFTTHSVTELRTFVGHGALMGTTVILAIVLRYITSGLRENELLAIRKLERIASQVAHDIRSPLTALKISIDELKETPESLLSLIRAALVRIEDIANDLLGQHGANKASVEEARVAPEWISHLVEGIISEKRVQFRYRAGVRIESQIASDCYGSFALAHGPQLKRALSNLINNAVEAIETTGTVTVMVKVNGQSVDILVKDSGKGMPKEILSQLEQGGGVSYGKVEGHGLGISQVRSAVESWGGALHLASSPGKGTTAMLALKLSNPPGWFLPGLAVPRAGTILIVDDERFTHDAWRSRLVPTPTLKIVNLWSLAQLREWVARNPDERPLVLLDHDFSGETENGLDAIESLKLETAVLVTHRFDDPPVVERCERLGVKVLPKIMVQSVPLQ